MIIYKRHIQTNALKMNNSFFCENKNVKSGCILRQKNTPEKGVTPGEGEK